MIDRKVLMAAMELAVEMQQQLEAIQRKRYWSAFWSWEAEAQDRVERRRQAVEIILVYFDGFREAAEQFFKARMR